MTKNTIISTSVIYAEILEVNEDSILVNCVLDSEGTKMIETRKFDIEPLNGVIDLQEGNCMDITITTEMGKRTFSFSNSSPDIYNKYFAREFIFKDGDHPEFFKQNKD